MSRSPADKFIATQARNTFNGKGCLVHDGNTFFIGVRNDQIIDPVIKEQFIRVCKAFNIDLNANNRIEKRFRQVVCGSGNEWKKINQLNSSALLAFLCFHKVGINNASITIGGEKYTDVAFEVRSPLEPPKKGEGRIPPVSNMDIVLLNKDKALFLESKFTEYLKPNAEYEVRPYYRTRYQELFKEDIRWSVSEGFEISFDDKKCCWRSSKDIYLEGIKQMICHYLGITHQRKENTRLGEDWVDLKLRDKAIILGEIMFRFDGTEYDNYEKAHNELSSHLKDSGVTVLDNLLTYQDIFQNDENCQLLTDTTKRFYGLGIKPPRQSK